jgi:hypothetical protein
MTDPKFQHTPGQLARWEADRLKREALTRPAPIGFDPSKAEIKFPRLTHGGQLTHAERKAERVQAKMAADILNTPEMREVFDVLLGALFSGVPAVAPLLNHLRAPLAEQLRRATEKQEEAR